MHLTPKKYPREQRDRATRMSLIVSRRTMHHPLAQRFGPTPTSAPGPGLPPATQVDRASDPAESEKLAEIKRGLRIAI